MKLLFIMVLNLVLTSAIAKLVPNMGHRAAGGPLQYYKNYPENSLGALYASIYGDNIRGPLLQHPRYLYLEFDIQETRDHKFVIFHDTHLGRMIEERKNQAAIQKLLASPLVKASVGKKNLRFRHLRIKHLSLAELKTLVLKNSKSERIPEMREFFNLVLESSFDRPVVIELKEVYSDVGREKFIKELGTFKRAYNGSITPNISHGHYDLSPSGVSIMSFTGKFRKSFGIDSSKRSQKGWCDQFKKQGYEKVFTSLNHQKDLCS